MSTTISFSPAAYSLLLLHAARYPANTVTGFLLGSVTGSQVTVEKIVTLGHHWTNLATIEDVALKLLDAHLSESSDANKLTLLGIYEAPSQAKTSKPSHAATRLAHKVAQRSKSQQQPQALNGSALAVLVDVSQLLLIPPVHSLVPFTVSPTNSTTAQPLSTSSASVQLQNEQDTIAKTIKAIREQGIWKDVRDFDDHLEDVSVDWLQNARALEALS